MSLSSSSPFYSKLKSPLTAMEKIFNHCQCCKCASTSKGLYSMFKTFHSNKGHYINNPNNALLWANSLQNYHTFVLFDSPKIGNLYHPLYKHVHFACNQKKSSLASPMSQASKSFFPRSPANNREAAYKIHHEHAPQLCHAQIFSSTKRPAKEWTFCYVSMYVCMYIHIYIYNMSLKFLSSNLTRF